MSGGIALTSVWSGLTLGLAGQYTPRAVVPAELRRGWTPREVAHPLATVGRAPRRLL
jgi:hypothetical protein